MANLRVKVTPNQAGISDLMRTDIARAMFRVGLKVEARAKALCPYDTGYLRSSINTRLTIENDTPIIYVGTDVEYATWVHQGTGIYGPHNTPIRPVRAKYLRFKPKGAKRYVYAKQVRGMRGRPFLSRALQEVVGGNL